MSPGDAVGLGAGRVAPSLLPGGVPSGPERPRAGADEVRGLQGMDVINKLKERDPGLAGGAAQLARHDGFLLCKRTIFMGRWIKHGGHYPSYHLRLFRRAKGRCEARAMAFWKPERQIEHHAGVKARLRHPQKKP